MGLLDGLLNTRDIPDLDDSQYPDHEQRLYRSFLNKMTDEGVTLPVLFADKFKSILHLKKNPHIIDAIKSAVQKINDANPNKNKTKFEEVKIDGLELIEKIPLQYFIPSSSFMNVITKRTQKKYTIRELMYELFPLYKDDSITYKLKFHGKIIATGTGEMGELFVPTEAIEKLNIQPNKVEMLTLELSLSGIGDNRRRHEESSKIFDTEGAKALMVDKEVQFDLFKKGLKDEQIIERAKLFGVNLAGVTEEDIDGLKENLVPSDFGSKQITDIRSVHLRFHQFESNEELLTFKGNLNLELEKMEEWLNRGNADGHNGFY